MVSKKIKKGFSYQNDITKIAENFEAFVLIMKIHLIAIGGAAMHNMAIALSQKGFIVSGSDDEINEPSASRLKNAGLLPEAIGWFPEKITHQLDAVILGMHAKADNPELQQAIALGIPVYSYPEYIYEQSKNKTRIVIGGSHGKTTITAMILHVVKNVGIDFDYMVGSQIAGFDTMVKLSNAPLIIVEGDEYLSSPIDRRPKFHLYQAHIGLISGIAWDHINVFPTFENYVAQFSIFANALPADGQLIYCTNDDEVKKVALQSTSLATKKSYTIPPHKIIDGITYIANVKQSDEMPLEFNIPLQIFGNHNLMNLEGARLVCEAIGIQTNMFYQHITTFTGAARRLEKVMQKQGFVMFKDFAHAPSKVLATTQAVKHQYSQYYIIACMELHTFSSLNPAFLMQYNETLAAADLALVYYNHHTVEHKKLTPISKETVASAFGIEVNQVFTNTNEMINKIKQNITNKTVLLMMTSGTFDGLNFDKLGQQLAAS